MCGKPEAATRSGERGNDAARAGQIQAYTNEVAAQAGRAVSEEHTAILIRLASAL